MPVPRCLTIATSDSGGGAGVVADIKTFDAHGVWGACAVVAVTAQNTFGVQAFETLPAALVAAQIRSVVSDIGVDAAKTGMLASAALVSVVAAAIRDNQVSRLVVDPVFVSKHGDTLLADDAVGALKAELLPLATVVTPNLPEAAALVGYAVDDPRTMEAAARDIAAAGPEVVLVKGGHLMGDTSPDCLLANGTVTWLQGPRIAGRHTHGTGCVLSAAIAAGVELGGGVGPVDPGWGRA